MELDRISYIKEHYSLIDYAHDVLGFPVQRPGDRCVSFAPGSKNPTAMLFDKNTWFDFKQGIGGDIIDLVAHVKHGGDVGAAIRELAGDYGDNYKWREKVQEHCNLIAYWHSQLRDSDYQYLRDRRIYKATADRLMIGYDEKEKRLIIPYWREGRIEYYAGRDRSNKPDAAKYKKAPLSEGYKNIPWGLHTFEEKHKSLMNDLLIKQYSAVKENPSAVKDPLTGEATSMTAKVQTLDALQNLINVHAVIAEGAFDALSFEQAGFRVLSPISGYFSKKYIPLVISVLKGVACVFICFDSDAAGNRFKMHMCKLLFKNRIPFVCGVLPEGFKDVSEYYEAGGNLYELVANARPGIEVMAENIKDENEFKSFVYEAARFVEKPDLVKLFQSVKGFNQAWLEAVKKTALSVPPDRALIQELLKEHNLMYIENDGFYEYTAGNWTKRSDNFVAGYFSELLGWFVNGSKIASLLKVLKAEITSEELFNRKPLHVFRNGTLEFKTGKFREHSPADMATIQMTYNYDPNAKCPLWELFVSQIMNYREDYIALLQEMAGYVLFEDCSLQKSFVLKGEGANGKSVCLNVLTAVFGDENVSNVSMSSLTDPFQRILLKDTLVNISAETNTNVKGAEDTYKAIVTGDKISGCFKNKDYIKFRSRSKWIMATNEFMRSSDSTKGFSRRLIFIDFPCTFEGKDADTELESKLMSELSGIFNWLYEGYKRLKKQGFFTQTTGQAAILGEYMETIDPVRVFIKEELAGANVKISHGSLYEKYVTWAKGAGYETMNKNNFTRRLKRDATELVPNFREERDANNRYLVFGAIEPQKKFKSLEEFRED